jgi:hypothetical protein
MRHNGEGLPKSCIYVFCVDLRTISNSFPCTSLTDCCLQTKRRVFTARYGPSLHVTQIRYSHSVLLPQTHGAALDHHKWQQTGDIRGCAHVLSVRTATEVKARQQHNNASTFRTEDGHGGRLQCHSDSAGTLAGVTHCCRSPRSRNGSERIPSAVTFLFHSQAASDAICRDTQKCRQTNRNVNSRRVSNRKYQNKKK